MLSRDSWETSSKKILDHRYDAVFCSCPQHLTQTCILHKLTCTKDEDDNDISYFLTRLI